MKDRKAVIVADLGYGDSGKGITIDTLARTHDAHTVVRYNGGAQAGHTVVAPDGRTHTFSQFGSATFVPNTATYLSSYMLIDPAAIINEETYLARLRVHGALTRHFIHRDAKVVTLYAKLINKLRERLRGDGRHGSCGMGIGETVRFALHHPKEAILMSDLDNDSAQSLRNKLVFQREYTDTLIKELRAGSNTFSELDAEWQELLSDNYIDATVSQYATIASQLQIVDEKWEKKLFKKEGTILFEGAQGVLLDERYGFHPFTTWSDTTYRNADEMLLHHEFRGEVKRLGVLRAYSVRHGAGPFITEDRELSESLPDSHNVFGDWQREFRVGWFDAVASRYALKVSRGTDALAITNIDRLVPLQKWKIATSYKGSTHTMRHLSQLPYNRDGLCRDIIPAPVDEGEMNGNLAKELLKAAPSYETLDLSASFLDEVKSGETALISKIEEELATPVALLGFGPSSNERYWRKPLFS